MFSFRQKIFFSYVFVFFLFLALLFPFATRTVNEIVARSLDKRADELISSVEGAPDDDALIRRLKELKPLIFFRMSVVTNHRRVLYDSHAMRLLGPRLFQEHVIDHPEINKAFREGVGYHEAYSQLFQQDFVYLAKAFDFHGKTYVLRLAFPYKYMQEITRDFEIGFLGLATAILLLFALMTWFIIYHLTNPINQIIAAVHIYDEEGHNALPAIVLPSRNPKDDFSKLARTLNSLSTKIQAHINSLTDERNEKELILESLVEGVIAVDTNLRVIYANDLALKFLKVERDTFINHDFHKAQQLLLVQLLESCLQDEAIKTATLELMEQGEKVYLEATAIAVQRGRSGAILVLNDKSQQYRLIEMRKDFIANASHELKTPITIIRGYAETLHDNPDLPVATRSDVTERIVKSCTRMSTLIKDLLTLSDVEQLTEGRLLRCNLATLLDRCIKITQEAYPSATITTTHSGNCNATIDEDLMELALTNLLENGVKYSPTPATVNATIMQHDDAIVITVKDAGIGIPPADIKHIFDRFYTVDKARSKKMGGTGLGLSLVQSIIHKHKGTIDITSTLGKGSTFTIRLPLSF